MKITWPILLILVLFFCTFKLYAQPSPTVSLVTELAGSADTVRALNPGSSEPLILVSSDADKKLILFKVVKGVASRVAEGTSLGHVWEATMSGDTKSGQIVVAYGLGRGDLNATLRVVAYPLTLTSFTEVQTFATERSQVNFLKAVGDHVVISYFTSKYETETGSLIPGTPGTWRYEKIQSIRMGTSNDASTDMLAIGRMYGDKQGQDGDLLLKERDHELVNLPSYRGVSSVAFYPTLKATRPNLLIGDGWHSNYGQLAQARLSMLTPVSGTRRYALDLLHIFENAYAVNRIFPTSATSSAPVILATNNRAFLTRPGADWKFKELYSQTNTDKVFDVQYLGAFGSELYMTVSDGAARIYRFSPDI